MTWKLRSDSLMSLNYLKVCFVGLFQEHCVPDQVSKFEVHCNKCLMPDYGSSFFAQQDVCCKVVQSFYVVGAKRCASSGLWRARPEFHTGLVHNRHVPQRCFKSETAWLCRSFYNSFRAGQVGSILKQVWYARKVNVCMLDRHTFVSYLPPATSSERHH